MMQVYIDWQKVSPLKGGRGVETESGDKLKAEAINVPYKKQNIQLLQTSNPSIK